MRYALAALRRLFRLSPTSPDVPGDDDREASGADPEYRDELRALAAFEHDMAAISDELGLSLLDPDDEAFAEDVLLLRCDLAELCDHFADRVDAIVNDWEPGWWEEPAVALPDFRTVHALIDETGEFAVVA